MMYYKTNNGNTVFSDCTRIYTESGIIDDPTPQQIADDGWLPYSPPATPHVPLSEPTTNELIAAIKKMLSHNAASMSDEDALAVAAIFPTWASKNGQQVNVDERYWYDEKLYKVIQQHTVQSDWTPDAATSLFVEVSIEEWPEWRQPTGAQDAYNTGDKVTFQGQHYVSLIDGNVYSPVDYPAGWEMRP